MTYQIVHDLNRRRNGPPLLFDVVAIKDEYKKVARARLKEPSDFMKHADRGKVGMMKEMTFKPSLNFAFILFAIIGLRHLRQDVGAEEITFELWHYIYRPELLTDSGKQLFEKCFGADEIDVLRTLPKSEFFERVRDSVRKDLELAEGLAAAHDAPPAVIG